MMPVQMNHIVVKSVAVLAVFMMCQGCDMLESHPYDVSVSGEKGLTAKNVAQIEASLSGRNAFVFAMISDTQRGYDETADAVKALNARAGIDFVVHGGDFSEYGATREFEWQRDLLSRLEMPWVSVIGNHDCIATGIDAYKAVFGPLDYSFTAGDVKFLCLNTNALEFDYSTAVPDFGFLKHELALTDPETRRTIVLMHAGPFSEQFNNNVADDFHRLLKSFPDLQFCLYGHGHNIVVSDPFGDGVMYYECAGIMKRSYLLFTVREDGYDYEVVGF